ncbi:metalloprotease family protein [Larkinella insperata]|uniref:Metalloprotease family protein n=1 Tax=Larkinella insperata TaxID=332158 RepID=A0ABW3QGE0_9BACT|nr:DUF3267 domain-containing protein [Larkinella insperata]
MQKSGRFTLVESFHIDEMNPFILRELGIAASPRKQVARLTGRQFLLFIGLGAIGGLVGVLLAKKVISIPWSQFPLALAGLLVLMPVHEAIHALAFKSLKAPDVGFGYSIKGLIIYAYAQRFVMTLNENALVAAMPFLIITAGLVVAWFYWPSLAVLWGTIVLLHTLLCIGDYVLVQYAWKNRHRTMFTYDDLTEQTSYFYEKR